MRSLRLWPNGGNDGAAETTRWRLNEISNKSLEADLRWFVKPVIVRIEVGCLWRFRRNMHKILHTYLAKVRHEEERRKGEAW